MLWYWPFARPEELPLACATARASDTVTVQVVNRDGAPEAPPCHRVTLLRSLPDVRREPAPGPIWGLSRAGTYLRRAQRRKQLFEHIAPDVLHLHYLNRFTDWAGPRTRDIPLVMSVHDVLPHDTRLPSRAEHVPIP